MANIPAIRCEDCAYSVLVPKWRMRPRSSKFEKATKAFECVRMPMPVLKLPDEWCGEFEPANTQGDPA